MKLKQGKEQKTLKSNLAKEGLMVIMKNQDKSANKNNGKREDVEDKSTHQH